jgi:hypothetical protein
VAPLIVDNSRRFVAMAPRSGALTVNEVEAIAGTASAMVTVESWTGERRH